MEIKKYVERIIGEVQKYEIQQSRPTLGNASAVLLEAKRMPIKVLYIAYVGIYCGAL